MTEEERINFDKCSSFRSCSASVCPLYSAVDKTYFIAGDKQCPKILDFLEGKEMPEELRDAIAKSEKGWRKALGDKQIARWLDARIKYRQRFKDMDSDCGVDVESDTREQKRGLV